MGQSNTTGKLDKDLTSEDIANIVGNIAKNYIQYKDIIIDDAIDAQCLLDSNEYEIEKIVDNITQNTQNTAHKKKLINLVKQLQSPPPSIQSTSSTLSSIASLLHYE
jgi:hypothetical protein